MCVYARVCVRTCVWACVCTCMCVIDVICEYTPSWMEPSQIQPCWVHFFSNSDKGYWTIAEGLDFQGWQEVFSFAVDRVLGMHYKLPFVGRVDHTDMLNYHPSAPCSASSVWLSDIRPFRVRKEHRTLLHSTTKTR
jgi:hypothetical protein